MLDIGDASSFDADVNYVGDNIFSDSQTTPSKRPKRRAALGRNFKDELERDERKTNPIGTPKKMAETPKKMFDCPICHQKFSGDEVDDHAFNCDKDVGEPSELSPASESNSKTVRNRAGAKHF